MVHRFYLKRNAGIYAGKGRPCRTHGNSNPSGCKGADIYLITNFKCSKDTGIFGQVSFLYVKMGTKTGRDRFSVYR